mgnify:FL=1
MALGPVLLVCCCIGIQLAEGLANKLHYSVSSIPSWTSILFNYSWSPVRTRGKERLPNYRTVKHSKYTVVHLDICRRKVCDTSALSGATLLVLGNARNLLVLQHFGTTVDWS